ncbi:MAG: hydroxyacid dehydrogenase, partial [Rectinemataceae bacterium]|nr:hydroxyacid dehydrogenase [Rectinemataceae bacterium]
MSDKGDLIVYTSDDGRVAVSLRAVDGSVWLTQLELAELFTTSKQNISLHINNILSEGELPEQAVVKEYLTTA